MLTGFFYYWCLLLSYPSHHLSSNINSSVPCRNTGDYFLSLWLTNIELIMLIVAKEFAKSLKEGTQDVQELADFLLKNNSAFELAYSLAELMCTVESAQPKKIVVSQEELNTIMSIFRVRGIAEDGTPIKSGRKRKDSPTD